MKQKLTVESAKSTVSKLLGKAVDLKVNRGRNKIKHYRGKVSELHQNVFVVTLTGDIFDRISCSYIDLVCGEIALKEQSSSAIS